jgi:hypothetical protein
VASGLQWLRSHSYDLDPEHPPLARVLEAFGPFVEGAAPSPHLDRGAQGNAIFERDGRYRHNLASARVGNLPFFVLAALVIGLWSRELFGNITAIVAVALFTSLPPVLAHAGLATTDMAVTAMTTAALFAFSRWLDQPTWRNAVFLGSAVVGGLLSKFSFLIFFPVAAAMLLVARFRSTASPPAMPYRRLAHVTGIALFSLLCISAAYNFSRGTILDARMQLFPEKSPEYVAASYVKTPGYSWVRPDLIERYREFAISAARSNVRGIDFVDWAKAAGYPSPLAGRHGNTLASAPLIPRLSISERILEPVRAAQQRIALRVIPAPLFVVGAEYVTRHSRLGHPAFLLGRYSDQGWWYYFPVVFFFKTPLPFVFLAIGGSGLLAITAWRSRDGSRLGVALAPAAMMIPPLISSINIGVRHILPVYPLFAMCAAFAVSRMWSTRRLRPPVVLLLGWYFIGTAVAHPDYLAYFNECAGRHPEQIAVDSNLDWGQDLLRLQNVMQQEKIGHLYLQYFGWTDWTSHDPRVDELPRAVHVKGWVAISEQELVFGGPNNRGDGYQWLRAYRPVRQVGKSIRLYFIR